MSLTFRTTSPLQTLSKSPLKNECIVINTSHLYLPSCSHVGLWLPRAAGCSQAALLFERGLSDACHLAASFMSCEYFIVFQHGN